MKSKWIVTLALAILDKTNHGGSHYTLEQLCGQSEDKLIDILIDSATRDGIAMEAKTVRDVRRCKWESAAYERGYDDGYSAGRKDTLTAYIKLTKELKKG